MPMPPTAFWVIAVKATGSPVVIRPSTRLDGMSVAPPDNAWAGVVNHAIRFTVLVCPGFTSHDVVMTAGVGNRFTALSVRLAMDWTAPEPMVTVSCDVLVTASAITWAAEMVPVCAFASRAPSASTTPGARRRRPSQTLRQTRSGMTAY